MLNSYNYILSKQERHSTSDRIDRIWFKTEEEIQIFSDLKKVFFPKSKRITRKGIASLTKPSHIFSERS